VFSEYKSDENAIYKNVKNIRICSKVALGVEFPRLFWFSADNF